MPAGFLGNSGEHRTPIKAYLFGCAAPGARSGLTRPLDFKSISANPVFQVTPTIGPN